MDLSGRGLGSLLAVSDAGTSSLLKLSVGWHWRLASAWALTLARRQCHPQNQV